MAVRELMHAKKWREAIKQCEPFISVPKIKAQKALCLVHLGEELESALRLAGELRDMDEIDEFTLPLLREIYFLLGKPGEMTKLHERAYSAHATSEEYGTELFFAYVREGNFGKQQQVCAPCCRYSVGSLSGGQLAMSMLKHFKKDRYLLWAVASMTQQVR